MSTIKRHDTLASEMIFEEEIKTAAPAEEVEIVSSVKHSVSEAEKPVQVGARARAKPLQAQLPFALVSGHTHRF